MSWSTLTLMVFSPPGSIVPPGTSTFRYSNGAETKESSMSSLLTLRTANSYSHAFFCSSGRRESRLISAGATENSFNESVDFTGKAEIDKDGDVPDELQIMLALLVVFEL